MVDDGFLVVAVGGAWYFCCPSDLPDGGIGDDPAAASKARSAQKVDGSALYLALVPDDELLTFLIAVVDGGRAVVEAVPSSQRRYVVPIATMLTNRRRPGKTPVA